MRMKQDDKRTKIQNRNSAIRIGCQGWNYDDWTTPAGSETVFYPRNTKPADMLRFYSKIFDTVEVDSTFYAIPPSNNIDRWYERTPKEFRFALKLPQEITHELALKSESFPILEEFSARVKHLGEKLAAVLIQMPPQFEGNRQNALALRNFLSRLPKDIRFAIEFRSRSWMIDWTMNELKKNNVAFAFVEGSWIPRASMFDAMKKPTADFSYVRFMGMRDLTEFAKVQRHQDANLLLWKPEIEKLTSSEILIYFSNFYEGHAPASAKTFLEMFEMDTKDAGELETQGSLF